jgi:hypothetical protein
MHARLLHCFLPAHTLPPRTHACVEDARTHAALQPIQPRSHPATAHACNALLPTDGDDAERRRWQPPAESRVRVAVIYDKARLGSGWAEGSRFFRVSGTLELWAEGGCATSPRASVSARARSTYLHTP